MMKHKVPEKNKFESHWNSWTPVTIFSMETSGKFLYNQWIFEIFVYLGCIDLHEGTFFPDNFWMLHSLLQSLLWGSFWNLFRASSSGYG